MAQFGSVLRNLGSVLNPQVEKELAAQEHQEQGFANQLGMLGVQRQFQKEDQDRQQRLLEQSPEYKLKMQAMENDKAFRDAVKGASGDMGKIAVAAAQYGKPELAVNLFNQQEERARKVAERADMLSQRRIEQERNHELALQRITDSRERQAEIARHNKALEALQAESVAARREALRQQGELGILRLEIAGDKKKADELRRVEGETTKLAAALEKANLPEADAVLGAVEKALEKSPDLPSFLAGPLAAVPDMALGAVPGIKANEIKDGRQAFQKLFNITLKTRSGAAVTSQELERLKKEFATGVWKTPEQIMNGVNQAREVINKHYMSQAAGFDPAALKVYNERLKMFGGRVVLEAPQAPQAPGAAPSVDDLLKKYGK